MFGLIKVGASGKDPRERAKELGGTHSPHAFVVEYDVLVHDFFALERAAHERLKPFQVRGDGQGSEFFRCTAEDAVVEIRGLVKQTALLETFHKIEREAVLQRGREAEAFAAEQLRAKERAELEKRKFQERLATAEVEKKRREMLENEARIKERLREAELRERREKWSQNQLQLIDSLSRDNLARINARKAFMNGTFAYCLNCKRPHIQAYHLPKDAKCEACGKLLGVVEA